jgi:hypothetical protein
LLATSRRDRSCVEISMLLRDTAQEGRDQTFPNCRCVTPRVMPNRS